MTNKASWSCSSTMAQRNCPSGRKPMITNQMYVPKYCQYENSATTQQNKPIVKLVKIKFDLRVISAC